LRTEKQKKNSWLEVDTFSVQIREAMDRESGGKSKILFREFPEIKEAYDLICSFRNFYKCKIGKDIGQENHSIGGMRKQGRRRSKRSKTSGIRSGDTKERS
jgi:hypothetical protein